MVLTYLKVLHTIDLYMKESLSGIEALLILIHGRDEMNKKVQKTIIAVSVLAIVLIFAWFLKDILVPYIRLEIRNDVDGARELLSSKGIFGCLAIVIVEALQMLVVFIPTEFIQISSSLSYPFYISMLLCELGVCLGATIIYILVRFFSFSSRGSEMGEARIDQVTTGKKKERGTILLMYILFIMPVISLGAICYYGSRKKLPYGKYILTVFTGVIPDIISANLIGSATTYFILKDLPFPILILLIVLLALILFTVLFIILYKVYFKEDEGTPDSALNSFFFRLVHLLRRGKQRLHVDDELIKDRKAPYVVLFNHDSFFDFYYSRQLIKNNNPAYVINRHLMSPWPLRTLGVKAGFIPKRMFSFDMTTPMQIMRMVRNGFSVVIFPQARLSITGRSYPILDRGAAFYRKLKCDLVIGSIRGAFFANPKWRKKFYKSDIYVRAEKVITKEEMTSMSDDELNSLIEESLYHDASKDIIVNKYLQKDKAEGLEQVLYRCAFCGELYTTKGVGNDFICSSCGKKLTLDETYHFTEEPYTIGDYYDMIEDLERKDLDTICLKEDVDTVIFSEKGRYRTKEKGTCTLSKEGFSYSSGDNSFSVGFDKLSALPFSCGKEFETYNGDRLYYFYTVRNKVQVVRWALLADLFKEKADEQ